MTSSENKSGSSNLPPMVIAVIALILSVVALLQHLDGKPAPVDPRLLEQAIYDRLLSELSAEIMPVYEDFGIKIDGRPQTLTALLKPLLSIDQQIVQELGANDG